MGTESPAQEDLLYARRARISLAMYRRMIDSGVLNENDRVELLHGTLVAKEPQSFPHADTIQRLTGLLVRGVGEEFDVRVQLPLTLIDDSEPEPDFAVVHRGGRGMGRCHPSLPLWVVEVAKTSARFDRTVKAALYARSGIPEYWVIDVDRGRVHVMREPQPDQGRYAFDEVFGPAATLSPTQLPGPTVRVAELLP